MSGGLSHAQAAELAKLARVTAEEAGRLAASAFAAPRTQARHKGAVDLVTETDLAVEALIRGRLSDATGFGFLGEEDGRTGPVDGPVWIVDPIDGTTNFAHRVPHFGVSIGLWSTDDAGTPGRPLVGCVVSPVAEETFWCDDRHARLGDTRLAPLEPKRLGDCLLATGFPYDRQTNPDNNVDLLEAFMKRSRGVRRFGAAALDMAWLAAGRVDGFWEPRLKAWDLAAGLAILDRVGGATADFLGAPHRLDSASVVAAQPAVLTQMLEVIGTQWRARP